MIKTYTYSGNRARQWSLLFGQILIPCLRGCIVDSRREPTHSVDANVLLALLNPALIIEVQ
jgi:hypothetical protein